MEQLPDHLFELISQKDFQSLTPEERTEILRYTDEAGYTALHEAARIGYALAPSPESIPANPGNKAILMQKLRDKHQPHLLSTPVALWKAAASILLFGFAFYFISRNTSVHPPVYITSTDTIYVGKGMPAEKIFDTVFITRYEERKGHESHRQEKASLEQNNVQMVELPSLNPLNQLTLDAYQQTEKTKRRKNIKDDSLIHSIGFVRL